MRTEPVIAGLVGLDAAVAAVLSAAVALGWLDLTGEQLAAIIGAVTALAALVAGVVRSQVRPVATSMSVAEADELVQATQWAMAVESSATDGAGAGTV